jgi:hypothetical protein
MRDDGRCMTASILHTESPGERAWRRDETNPNLPGDDACSPDF